MAHSEGSQEETLHLGPHLSTAQGQLPRVQFAAQTTRMQKAVGGTDCSQLSQGLGPSHTACDLSRDLALQGTVPALLGHQLMLSLFA